MAYTSSVGNSQLFQTAEDVAVKPGAAAKTGLDGAAAAASSGAAAPASDQTSLSTAGGLVAQALTGSDVRSDRVAALQQTIADGTYSVSASDVADKLMNTLLR